MNIKVLSIAAVCLYSSNVFGAITYNLNVEFIQVRDDDGLNPTSLFGSDGGDYRYQSQINEIFAPAGIQVTFSNSTWDNTQAQRITTAERNSIYNDTFTSTNGDPLPALAQDGLQIFFVMDHSGTGFDGSDASGWVGSPLPNPNFSARNAGNAQLFISGTFVSNGRSVIANEGFTADSLSTTIAHEIGHMLGLRHMEDASSMGAGTTQDPMFTLAPSTANLMWEAGGGPSFNATLDNDTNLTALQENAFLRQDQIDAAIFNGLALDPDGNGIGVLQAIPEPTSSMLAVQAFMIFMLRRKR